MPKRVYPYHKSRRWAFLWLAIQRYFLIFWHSRVATPNIEGEGHCARYLSMTSHREIKVTIIIRKNEQWPEGKIVDWKVGTIDGSNICNSAWDWSRDQNFFGLGIFHSGVILMSEKNLRKFDHAQFWTMKVKTISNKIYRWESFKWWNTYKHLQIKIWFWTQLEISSRNPKYWLTPLVFVIFLHYGPILEDFHKKEFSENKLVCKWLDSTI